MENTIDHDDYLTFIEWCKCNQHHSISNSIIIEYVNCITYSDDESKQVLHSIKKNPYFIKVIHKEML